MQIKISTRHGHLSDGHQAEINAKCEKLLHFFSRITMIEVTVDLADRIFKSVEIKVDAEHKHDFIATDRAEDLKVAVDLAFDRVQHQIHKYKEKIQNHHP